MTEQQKKLLRAIKEKPYLVGHLLGFNKLTELHNEWIQSMLFGADDETLQAHRGSYKTTCVSIALALIILLYPNEKTLFCRKTDTDVQEIIAQVKKILQSNVFQTFAEVLYGFELQLITDRVTEINTNLAANDPRGTSQLVGRGSKGSITGKHFDRIFTDDIVNVEDRTSKAERDKTKLFYMELQNIKNRGGRIFNTGTPWHKDDCFTIMPNPAKWSCYETGLMSADDIESTRSKMTASLFCANYELKHVADDNVIFMNPVVGFTDTAVLNGEAHVDASYGGEDGTAFTIMRKKDGKYYVLGKLWHKHVDMCEGEMLGLYEKYLCNRISCENNADKGYLAKELRKKGLQVHSYTEHTNKFFKITSYLKNVWEDVVFVEGTDPEYIEQICDYNIDAERDDAPDSLACLVRKFWGKEPLPKDTYSLYL